MKTGFLIDLLVVSVFLLLASCSDSDVSVLRDELDREPMWETRIYFNLASRPGLPNLMNRTAVAQGTVMVGYTDGQNLRYAGLDVETGVIQWVSSETNRYFHNLPDRYVVQVGDEVYFYGWDGEKTASGSVVNSTPLYAYHIPSGALLFKKVYPRRFGGSLALLRSDGRYLVSLEAESPAANGSKIPSFWVSEYPDFGNQAQLAVPLVNNFTYENGSKMASGSIDFTLIREGGETFLVYMMAEPKFSLASLAVEQNSLYHINCYNLTTGRWVYTNKPAPFHGLFIAVDGENLYYAKPSYNNDETSGLRCFNWKTGEQKWYLADRTIDPINQVYFAYAGYDKASKTIVTNEISAVYGIDAITGTVKWKAPSIATATSPILIHNGVAYVVSGNVYAFDVVTGEVLMRAHPPKPTRKVDGVETSGFFFDIGMHIRENGKPIIIARDLAYAYAFEGVR